MSPSEQVWNFPEHTCPGPGENSGSAEAGGTEKVWNGERRLNPESWCSRLGLGKETTR